MSAAWTIALNIMFLFLPERSFSFSGSFPISIISFYILGCLDMSVHIMFSMMLFRLKSLSASLKFYKTLHSCWIFSNKKKKLAVWWFSKTAASLYNKDNLLLVLVSKTLLVPGWSISWAAPDIKTKKISKSVIEHISLRPQLYTIEWITCITSAAWAC